MHFANLYWWLYIITVHQASSASFSLAILIFLGYFFFFFVSCCFFEEQDSIYHNKHLLSSYSLPRHKHCVWEIFFFPKEDGASVHGVSLYLRIPLSPTPKTYYQVLLVIAIASAVKVNYKDSCWIPDRYKYLVILGFPAEPNQRYCLLKSYCLCSEEQGQAALEWFNTSSSSV